MYMMLSWLNIISVIKNIYRPYSPIQNIFFGPLLPRGDRPPIQQRGHTAHQSQQQQQTLHQQNSKSSLSSNTGLTLVNFIVALVIES